MNLAELLTIPAGICPDTEILRVQDDALTYTQLQARVAGAAAALTELGVGSGDVVALLDTNGTAAITALYACAALGAIFVPLNFRARTQELAHMLGSTAPKLVLAGSRYVQQAQEALGPRGTARILDVTSLLTDDSVDEDGWLEPVETEDDTLAALLFTSGTTAAAKAVMLAHANLVDYVLTVSELATGEERGSILIAAPLHHIAGLAAILSSTWAGRRMVLMSQFDPGEWLRLAAHERITHAFLVLSLIHI